MTSGAEYGGLIVLEGIDGAGKTALRDRVAEALHDCGVDAQSSKEIAPAPDFAHHSMTRVASLLWPREDTDFDHHLRPEYWLYLQALWYTLATQFVIGPKLESGRLLLADGWYFKFFAKLRLRGFQTEFLDSVFRPAVEPDLVILLDPDVTSVWGRKRFTLREMGLHGEYSELGYESFVDYQSRVRTELRGLASERDWVAIGIGEEHEPGDTARLVEEAIRAYLDRSGTRQAPFGRTA